MSGKRIAGFTLIELMVVIAIVAILAALAFPSFESSMRSNRVATTTNEMLATLSLARSEAIRNRARGTICTSPDGAQCDVASDWSNGWLVWADTDGNGSVNGVETVQRYVQGKSNMEFTGTVNRIAFDERGRAVGGAQSIELNPAGVTSPVRCVLIGPTGQTRITKEACP